MSRKRLWDYLIVTASNDAQARAYESQLKLRRRLGFLSAVRHVLVVADPEGRRVGSGGSTLCCLLEVVNRELRAKGALASSSAGSPGLQPDAAVESVLRHRRILIVHAGGDSRRLPAYGPCGKIFIPVPGEGGSEFGVTLFDRLAPEFLNLPPGHADFGQVVMAAGDALILFDASHVSLDRPGLTALACPATPELASKHGVFCAGSEGQVRLYLQKPNVAEQQKHHAINPDGQSLLDIGIMSLDGTVATALFRAFGIKPGANGKLEWSGAMQQEVLARGLDFFREICCAMGGEATVAHHRQQARGAGSSWSDNDLKQIFTALAAVPFHLQIVPQARFLHFGTSRQLITSGSELRRHDSALASPTAPLSLNNEFHSCGSGTRVTSPARRRTSNYAAGEDTRAPVHGSAGGEIIGANAWVEGCRLGAPLALGGQNVVIGVEVDQPLALPQGACLDVLRGKNRNGQNVWFIRCYGIDDTFKENVAKGGTLCGLPLLRWLAEVGAKPEEIWEPGLHIEQRSLWDARVFPAEATHAGYRHWLWMFNPARAMKEEKEAFIAADRYSAAEIAVLADQEDFFARRRMLRLQTSR